MASDAEAQYATLLELNRGAFAAGRFRAAYHVLLSAMHCADELGDVGRLAEVAERAKEQGEWLNRNLRGFQPAPRLLLHPDASGRPVDYASIVLQALELAERLGAGKRKGE